uniref:Uncharacterized protein n=1 Tax=viral metagenome TaxID=1070528 RepID=A0A6C0BAB1_9ZZZZ
MYPMATYVDATAPNTVSAVSFGEPKTNASGGKNVALFHNRAIYTFTTPMVPCYGVNENNFDGKAPTYDITIQLGKDDESMAFIQNMLNLERLIKEEALKQSRKWFGKQLSELVLSEFWTPFVKFPKNKETGEVDLTKSPTLRVKLSYFDGAFKYLEAYNVSNQLIYPKNDGVTLQDLIPKGSEVKCLVRLNGIWFAGGKFGLTGKPIQIIVRPKARIMPGVCQMMMPSVSSTPAAALEEDTPTPPVAKSTEMNVSVEDSDDEDPDKEYASTPAETTETEPVEPETSEAVTGASPPPVKRRPRVVKKD